MHLHGGCIISNPKSTINMDLPFNDTLRDQVTNERVESLKVFQLEHFKIDKNHNNNHYRQVHHVHHQYNYQLGYSNYDNFNEKVMRYNKIEAPIINDHHKP